MSAQLFDLATDHDLSETVGDAALAAVLRDKPSEEEIPSAVWWLLAETLRTSVVIRREVDRHVQDSEIDLCVLLTEATLLADAALVELVEATGARPVPIQLPAAPLDQSLSTTRPGFSLQLSVLFLARMLVSHRVTSAQRLANALAAHLRALSLIEPQPAVVSG
jgi:hypothetical protein